MNYEQMFAAILALGEASLMMRKPGDWYVSQSRVEVKEVGSSVLSGEYGNGSTPELAIRAHWMKIALIPTSKIVVLDAMRDTRRHVRWNGFMWADVPMTERDA